MNAAQALRNASTKELRRRIVTGHPVDPRAIEGWAYRGTSLGLPKPIERLTWKTFQKTFHRDERTGRLIGWNVRLEQDGLDAPSRPIRVDGKPLCVWHYEVIEPRGVPMPRDFDRGLIIDYSRSAANPLWEPVNFAKDPLIALEPGNYDALLGVSYAVLGGFCLETPTYFTLERDHRIDFVPEDVG